MAVGTHSGYHLHFMNSSTRRKFYDVSTGSLCCSLADVDVCTYWAVVLVCVLAVGDLIVTWRRRRMWLTTTSTIIIMIMVRH